MHLCLDLSLIIDKAWLTLIHCGEFLGSNGDGEQRTQTSQCFSYGIGKQLLLTFSPFFNLIF